MNSRVAKMLSKGAVCEAIVAGTWGARDRAKARYKDLKRRWTRTPHTRRRELRRQMMHQVLLATHEYRRRNKRDQDRFRTL